MKPSKLNVPSRVSLPMVSTFEQYEIIKLKVDLFIEAAKEIIATKDLANEPLAIFSEGTNIVFALGTDKVIKIYPPFHREQFDTESLVLSRLSGKLCIKTPQLLHKGEISGWPYI
ncbi:MAG: hypothetical protein JWM09_818 [Francisellaceae bacterium]|nr:hypothetical protein [Francisellaceae bacterium]